MEKHDYVIKSTHGIHSPGTPCKAWRQDGQIHLEFSESDVVILEGNKWYLFEIENRYKLWQVRTFD